MATTFFHLGQSLTSAGVLTVTNSTNVASGDRFVLCLGLDPNNFITGAPVNYTIGVNGNPVALKNTYGANISTDKLIKRVTYYGYYFEPTDGSDPYVVINTRCRPCESQSSVRTGG